MFDAPSKEGSPKSPGVVALIASTMVQFKTPEMPILLPLDELSSATSSATWKGATLQCA